MRERIGSARPAIIFFSLSISLLFQSATSVVHYHGGSFIKALQELYPSLHLDANKFTIFPSMSSPLPLFSFFYLSFSSLSFLLMFYLLYFFFCFFLSQNTIGIVTRTGKASS